MFEKIIIIFISVNTIFLLGYALGRRIGKAQGEKIGYQESKTVLRMKANIFSQCPICNQYVKKL
ncbi:hypothetical protein SAMN03080614_10074 [Anaerobranca gottschalkii DSM 13577]|uniref:Uncharacterized protein n=1 Tax=Anaerobranca gottschalkii DSM 13577 TaxID=1120990 RepID=A0A1H9Z6Z9_9FIRM|nr:hypothetical protein SAMN03080614_10074 [Anaerobranca gottschalkii DSM 13577]